MKLVAHFFKLGLLSLSLIMGIFAATNGFSQTGAFLKSMTKAMSAPVQTGHWITPSPTPSPEPSPSPEPTPEPTPSPTIEISIHHRNGDSLGCNGLTRERGIDIDWTDSLDPDVTRYWVQQTAGPAATFSPNPKLVPLGPGQSLASIYRDNLPNIDGLYTFRATGGDINGPYDDWSEECSITLDLTGPSSAITVSSSPTRDIEERITNGGFEDGLNSWITSGEVTVIEGSDNHVQPFQTKMARIQNTGISTLSQDVSHTATGNGTRSISFAYNFAAYEDSLSGDQPGLMVFAGADLVYQAWADDLTFDGDASTLDASGWQTLTIDLTYVEEPTLTLAFYGGSNPTKPAYIYVDEVSTNVAVVNRSAKFTLTSINNDPGDQVFYALLSNGVREVQAGASPLEFSLTGPTDNNQVEYWGTDALGNEEVHKQFVVYFDDSPPETIAALQAEDLGTGSGILTWTAPADVNPFGINSASSYQVKYSPSPIATEISKEDWSALPSLVSQPPLRAGNRESLAIQVPGAVTDYYFAIRAKDRAGNLSALGEGSLVKLEPKQLESALELTRDEVTNTVQFKLANLEQYANYDYVISYTHPVEGQPVQEALIGNGSFEADATDFTSEALYLGTCSEGGVVCVPHLEINDLKLTLTLTGEGLPEKVLEKSW